MLHHHFNLKNDKAAPRFVRMCSVAALFAIASLPGSASASPISAGTRAAVLPEAVLLQEVQCQQVYRLQGRRSVRRVICNRSYPRSPLPPGQRASLLFLPQFLPQAELGPVGAPRF
jgi:hypothetical protein